MHVEEKSLSRVELRSNIIKSYYASLVHQSYYILVKVLYGEHIYRPKNHVQRQGLFKASLVLLLSFNELEYARRRRTKMISRLNETENLKILYRMYESIYFVRQKN